MGQKVHPKVFRIGINKDWDSRWIVPKKQFADVLHEDQRIRKFIKGKLYAAGISRVEIERAANRLRITIHTGKPGLVIGQGGTRVEELRKQLEAMTGKHVSINIAEVKVADLDAQLVAESVASQLEKRISHRRAMKSAISRAMRAGAKGVRIIVSGRIAGAEIARRERASEGKVPLGTLRADIDYGFAEARTTYGQIGVKVWIYRGEILPDRRRPVERGA
ncbi:MAG: 30S ribosomal protein S3 [Firmicutes bacterium]|nr:30S ribosomal protein S3 [Bacillota bacterium]